MALRVRDAGASAKKFADRAAAATPDYKAGIAGAGNAWQANTTASTDNYNAGVQGAISRNAFAKGVTKAGGGYWESRASTLGANRFADGVRAGQSNYSDGVAPYLDTLSKLNLPARGPKGDPRNLQRAADVATALRLAKTGS
jgi:hypothetical protein